jgi:hypothetical protein
MVQGSLAGGDGDLLPISNHNHHNDDDGQTNNRAIGTMYLAGLDIHDLLARSPVSHATGVEGIVWWTTVAGVVRTVRRHTGKGAHHPHTRRVLPTDEAMTGIPQPVDAKLSVNIGQKPPTPLLVKILSPLAHGFIIVTPLVYIIGTGIEKLNQPEWFTNWALPDGEDYVGFGGLAAVRTIASIANYSVFSLWKRASKELRRAVSIFFSHTRRLCLPLILEGHQSRPYCSSSRPLQYGATPYELVCSRSLVSS